ncbi:MAG TPA: hypothetical protein VJT31_07885, partial [Rugosimonospora sp.]|nr:hypothetical protein [Rugosimonospora sp.]
MSYVDPPGWPDPAPPEVRGAYRARHGPAAPETYGPYEQTGEHSFGYGDGFSPYPLYGGEEP